MKLLPFVGAKKIFGKFASGNINHIGIKKLQLILYKVCLMLGVEVVAPCALVEMSGILHAQDLFMKTIRV